ncbi:MAG: PAS domain S-box protein [Deltaproteobacteria bacterium]|nr:PAS domain S-box protein [Deltaproteobacteria bacterium]
MPQNNPISTTHEWLALFNAINDAILILDCDQRVVRANRASEEFFKMPVVKMTGRFCWEIVGCKDYRVNGCPCLNVKKSNARENIELELKEKCLQIMVDPLLDNNGNFNGSIHSFRDITLNKEIENALQRSEYKYHALYEKMLNGCALHEIICDESGRPVNYRYLDVNPAFEDITGFRADALIGKTALEIMPEMDPFLIETYGNVALTGEPVSFDFENRLTGRHFVITAYQPEKGQFACIFQNVTEQKRAEKDLRESEQKFRLLAENPVVGIFICQDTRFLYVNDRLAEMHGYSKEEIIGKQYYMLIHPDQRDSYKERMEKQLSNEGIYKHRFEMLRIKKNGGTFWGGAIVTRGHYYGKEAIFGSVIDISESKKAEEELKKSEERYKEIVEDTNDLIIKVDNKGLIVFANYMANRIFGLPREDIIGMHISKCIHPDDKDNTRRLIDAAVSKKATSTTFENRQVSQAGEIRHLFWTSNFHYDSSGNLTDVTSIARDMTRRREIEEELKKAHDDLEQRVKERTRELQKANEELQEKTTSLVELNTALKILLDRREKDKEENGEKILLNVKELLIPYINRLKSGPLNENQKNYVGLVESGLQDIISPFAQKLTSRYMHISPRELQVSNLVKDGKTSKEIADTLNTTERTVVAHRANLRKKLGLGKKANLRTYLLSLK